ncbi:hypothetical protein CS0771_16830 [Catellatospora sp. IY07-71]|uniref:hypothetical protein n=1 Tax=Catellatospora sp. IY07-71 TaxID=2728827 RepID=UPI001BB3FD40|nr:hypothetical protein [Catellatospora sp. IY07-71]BCJ72139.1 hypothetical protein CS0771_16830 [Catellatospora sp. IY07-71]
MRRQLAVAGSVALVSLSSLAVLSAPASAGVCDRPAGYAARAGADLLKVGAVNLGPLGVKLPAVADLTVASAGSGMSATNPVHSAATARYADARLLGLELPTGPLAAKVYQQAPPSHQNPVRNNALTVDLGLIKAGTGDIAAHARWTEGMGCGKAEGPAGEADASLVDAKVLPGSRGALAAVPHTASATTQTATVKHAGVIASGAYAQIGLAEVQLLGGALGVEVVKPPALTVLATGRASTSSVRYDAPLLKVTGPGIGTRTLDSLHRELEIAVPAPGRGGVLGALDLTGARERAKALGLPLLDTDLGRLLGGLPVGDLTQLINGLRGGSGGSGLPSVPELGGLPDLGGLLGGGLGNLSGLCEIVIVKISIGELDKRVTDRGATAQAASLRVQLIGVNTTNGKRATVLDLGIGLLKASATAPVRAAASPTAGPTARPSSSPSPDGPGGGGGATPSPASGNDDDDDNGCGGPGCSLPRTGTSIALIAGTGVLLFVAGRFLLLLTRRRTASGPEDLLG